MAINSGNSALAEDAHPIHPFHEVLRKHEFYPVQSSRSDNGSRINYYSQTTKPGMKSVEPGKSPAVMIAHNKQQGITALARDPRTGSNGPTGVAHTPSELNTHLKLLNEKKKGIN